MYKNVYAYDEMKRGEHMAVRKTVGWYLWTHQLVEVTGKDAVALLEYIFPKHSRLWTHTYNGSHAAFFVRYPVQHRKCRSPVCGHPAASFDFNRVKRSVFFNNKVYFIF